MSESTNTPVTAISEDLDTFSAELFGQSKAPSEETTSQSDPTDDVDDSDATETETVDTQTIEDDNTLAPEDDVDETTDEADTAPKKKNRYQERIDELTSKYREEQRQREAERQAFEERLRKLETPVVQNTAPAPTISTDTGPDPLAKNADGRDKYPLGEYDPNYITDLTGWKVEQKLQAITTQNEEAKRLQAQDAQAEALHESWNSKLTPAQERYPDFLDKSQELLGSLNGLDPNYENYIAATIMGMDYGPDVLYYLASNPSEARTIINSGAAKATITLGRLEAKFAEADAEKTLARPKVSNAPAPPPTNRGTSPAKMSVPADTDDLDAFTREMFKKR